jgi:mannose-6-phosphate isomerase-like protein (cupin superfamily)
VIGADGAAVPVEVGPTLYEDLDRNFDGFKGRHLVACYTFDVDWPGWEMHPAGDEIVCLLSGEVRMVFEREGREEITQLSTLGSYVIVPKGTWHTARVVSAAKMLFITPGEGTLHRDK